MSLIELISEWRTPSDTRRLLLPNSLLEWLHDGFNTCCFRWCFGCCKHHFRNSFSGLISKISSKDFCLPATTTNARDLMMCVTNLMSEIQIGFADANFPIYHNWYRIACHLLEDFTFLNVGNCFESMSEPNTILIENGNKTRKQEILFKFLITYLRKFTP